MKAEYLQKIKKQLLKEKSENEYQITINQEKARISEASQFENKLLMSSSFSLISYFILVIVSRLMSSFLGTLLVTNSIYAIIYPTILIGSSLLSGSVITNLLYKILGITENKKTISKAKTEREKLRDEVIAKSKIEELINKNILIDKVIESLNYNIKTSNLNTNASKEEFDNFLVKESKQYEKIEKLSTKKVLNDKFGFLINNPLFIPNTISKALMIGLFVLILYGCPQIFMSTLLAKSASITAFIAAFGIGSIGGLTYLCCKNKLYKNTFKEFNSNLSEFSFIEDKAKYNDSFIEKKQINFEIEQAILKSINAKLQLEAERVILGEKLKERQKEDTLFNYSFGRVKITKELRDDIIAHPSKYPNLPVRVQMGKFYTDEEYENRANQVLNTPLPGSEKGIVRKRKK